MVFPAAHKGRIGRLTAPLAVLLVFILFTGRGRGAEPASVLIISSSDVGPYKAAKQGLNKVFTQAQPALTVGEYDMERIKPDLSECGVSSRMQSFRISSLTFISASGRH